MFLWSAVESDPFLFLVSHVENSPFQFLWSHVDNGKFKFLGSPFESDPFQFLGSPVESGISQFLGGPIDGSPISVSPRAMWKALPSQFPQELCETLSLHSFLKCHVESSPISVSFTTIKPVTSAVFLLPSD